MERNFRQMLTQRQETSGSLLCVGLDPLLEKMPKKLGSNTLGPKVALYVWMRDIVDATAPLASMYKLQRAHWEAIDYGIDVMRKIIDYIKKTYPDIPVFLDCKRGDIDRTQTQYREAHFTLDGVDGMNYNGYMGKDTLRSLVDKSHLGRALVGLGRTSNSEAWEVQDIEVAKVRSFGRHYRLWEVMVEHILAWSEEFGVIENAGVVMGAAYKTTDKSRGEEIISDHLERARELVGDKLWFLIPGIGTQGGAVAETVITAYCGPGSMAVNSSSGIIFASQGDDYAVAARYKARELRDELNQHRDFSPAQLSG